MTATSPQHRPDKGLSKLRPKARASKSLSGTSSTKNDSVLQYMKDNNVPLTREKYLKLAYGDPNIKLDGEAEMALPEQFQKA